jgi:hypothetical protein
MPAGGGKAQQHSPEGVRATILRFFTEKGLTPNQAAGIAGNLQQESSFNPADAGGYLAQWTGSRLAALEAFAKAKGHPTASGRTEVQLEYLWSELNGPYRGALEQLRRTRTPEEAARVVSVQYEKPGNPNLPARERYAREAAQSAKPGSWGGPLAKVFEAPGAAAEGVVAGAEGVVEGAESVGDLIKIIADPTTWLRVAEGVGGMVLLAMGLKTLTRGSGTAGPLGEVARQGREVTGIAKKTAEVAGVAAVV